MNKYEMGAGVAIMLVGLVLTVVGLGTDILPQSIGYLGVFAIAAGVGALFYFKK